MAGKIWLFRGIESFRICSSAFWSTVLRNGSEDDVPNVTFDLDHTENQEGTDWIVLLIQFLLVHSVSWWGRWIVSEPFFVAYKKQCVRRRRDIKLFSHIVNACLFHSLSAYFGWKILAHRDWIWDQSRWNLRVDDVPADLKFYVLLYAARYTSDSVSLLFEIVKEDSWAFAVHHVASVPLVLVSAQQGYVRIGGVFMLFLDWVDIVLTGAKTFKYLSKRRNDVFQVIADRLFEVFAVMFFLTRNVLFSYVAYVCIVDFEDLYLLKTLLLILVGLMTYWMMLIVRTAMHQLFGDGSVDDLREEDVIVEKEANGKAD